MKLFTAIGWKDLKIFCRTLMGITCFDINLDSCYGLQKRNYGQVLIPVRLILWEVLVQMKVNPTDKSEGDHQYWNWKMKPTINNTDEQGQVVQRWVLFEWMFFLNDCFFMNECYLWMNKWFIEWIGKGIQNFWFRRLSLV